MEWNNFFEHKSLKIYYNLKGEIRYGPTYLNLKSDPVIKEFNNKIFGDWFYTHDSILYLQEWNFVKSPNTNLVSINLLTFEYKVILENIKSVFWEMRFKNDCLFFIDQFNKKTYLISQ